MPTGEPAGPNSFAPTGSAVLADRRRHTEKGQLNAKKPLISQGLFLLAEKEGHSPATSQGTDLHTN